MDTATGFPVVPEGYFWRVGYVATGLFKLQLRKKMRVGSRRIGHSLGREEDLTPDSLRIRADRILEDEQARMNRGLSPLYGDYPPKTLGGAA